MVALLYFSVRVVKRLDEIIERRAGTDRRQVRADFTARAADGVATHAAELELAVDQLAPDRVAGLLDRSGQRENFAPRQSYVLILQPGTSRQRQRQRLQIAPSLPDCT